MNASFPMHPIFCYMNHMTMKYLLSLIILLSFSEGIQAQKVDSIFFHLYTDSLKKGTHNYINVDGKMSNGRWKPLSSKEVDFTASGGVFTGNELFIPLDFAQEKVVVKAVLREKPELWREVTIWVKRRMED